MGYSYSMSGKLSCDQCGRAEGDTRKRPCPAGYCPASALCAICWEDAAIRADFNRYHVEAGCARSSAKFRAEQEERAQLEAAGVPVRCSALAVGGGVVQVIFRSCRGEVGRYMPERVYAALPLLVNATLADYEREYGGQLPEAPAEFSGGPKATDAAALLSLVQP